MSSYTEIHLFEIPFWAYPVAGGVGVLIVLIALAVVNRRKS
jgi:hypothetical protein